MDALASHPPIDDRTDVALWIDDQLRALGFSVPSHEPLRRRLMAMDIRPVINLIDKLNGSKPEDPRLMACRRNLAEMLEITDATPARKATDREFGELVKAYSRSAAVQFQAAQAEDQARTPTLRIEVAPREKGQGANWNDKLVVQVSRKDLPLLAAVVLGEISAYEARFYGEQHNKSITIRNEGAHLVVALSGPGARHQGIMGPSDRFWAAGLVLRQLHQANPGLDGTSLRYLIRQTAHLYLQGQGSQHHGKGHPGPEEDPRP